VIVADRETVRTSDLKRSTIKSWSVPQLTVDSTDKKVQVGIDGSLHKMKSPVAIHIDHAALRVVLPTTLVRGVVDNSVDIDEAALAHLSGRGS